MGTFVFLECVSVQFVLGREPPGHILGRAFIDVESARNGCEERETEYGIFIVL